MAGIIERLIDELIEEHHVYLSKIRIYQKEIEDNFSNQLVESIIHFLKKDIEEHAQKEETKLIEEILKMDPDYDEEAIIFGHNTIREATEDLEYSFEDFKKGKINKKQVIKYINKVFTIIKDHFQEEENFLFPDVRNIEKEWL